MVWHSSVAWNPSACQVLDPKSYTTQIRIDASDRRTVQCHSTVPSAGVPGGQSTHTSYAALHPTHTLFFFSSLSRAGGYFSSPAPLRFFSLIFLIGLIPCSLASPIIFLNIQGNVSSCCHSNYYNIQHGSWLSSFWMCFSFFFSFFF